MQADPWKLTRRLPLLAGKQGKRVSVFAPVVGAEALAIAVDLEFRFLLDRQDLAVQWKGRLEATRPVGWDGKNLHLLDEDWRFVVWDSVRKKQEWATDGADRGYALCGDELVLIPTRGRLQMRDARTGRVVRELGVRDNAEGFQVVGDRCILFLDDDHLEGLSLSTGETAWSVSLRDAFQGLAPTKRVPLGVVPLRSEALLLQWRPGLGALDAATGRFRWTRELGLDASPLVSQGRVAMLGSGHLFLCDDATGETIVDVSGATPTLWECPPVTHDDRMIVVDEQGHIVTVALSDGEVVGVQKEKGTGFMGCISVDGRLLVGGLDGALWVYEPTEKTQAAARGRSVKASVPGESTPGRSSRLARGTGSRRAAASKKKGS